ncbi:MAG: hypothetical protein H6754_07490 [Candidatus Omnitrophica bacterium]|nr:hypothetical protein [Candidatus Omnitrophota bacterium]
MPSIEKLKSLFKNDWVIGLSLLFIFLIANGYTYAWDDQHLEIPLLKSLIDPQLYVGDYYVDALKNNFTSFLFPLLAKVITVDQIPTTYFILYLLSRFFLFFFAFKLWKHIAQNHLTAGLCVLSFILVFRVEEFLYRTFSHQEFALAIIMAAMYSFYKDRFGRAAILFGIAANFHALYSLFPFCYMALYLLYKSREDHGKRLIKSVGLFLFFSLPVLIWTLQRVSTHVSGDLTNWMALYQIACPQTFLFDNVSFAEMLRHFSVFLKGTQQFWPTAALIVLNITTNSLFQKDGKAKAFIVGGSIFLILSFIFSYVFPSRFILDLNLVRNLQFMQFILIGYTTILLIQTAQTRRYVILSVAVILFSLLRFNNYIATLACLALLFLLREEKGLLNLLSWLLFVVSLIGIAFEFSTHQFSKSAIFTLQVTIGLVILFYVANLLFKNEKIHNLLKVMIIMLPFVALTGNYIYYHQLHNDIEKTGGGFWQLQRNWIDMQNYVRKHTPKSALILTPNNMEMGGFRIFSERKVLVCYRDCGIIGFNYPAAVEWQKRLKTVEHFKVIVDGDITSSLINAITQYHVNYIVFMRYITPGKNSLLEPIYENETFVLYRVMTNPI